MNLHYLSIIIFHKVQFKMASIYKINERKKKRKKCMTINLLNIQFIFFLSQYGFQFLKNGVHLKSEVTYYFYEAVSIGQRLDFKQSIKLIRT